MLSNLEIYRRATSGEICSEKDFDLKRFIPAVRRLVKEYGIAYDPASPVSCDDELAERVWQAGKALFLETGVYCVDTERLIMFDEAELDQALAHAPRPVTLGSGQQARVMPARRPESSVLPFFSLGGCGLGVTSDELFMSLVQAYCELPYTDAVTSPALTQVDGLTITAGSPLEVEGCVRTVTMTREATRRAGRAGLGIANTVATGVKAQGHIAGNAAAADQGDMMEIGGVAELKIDFDSMSKIAFMQGRGRTILGESGVVLGGYAGGPRGLRGHPGGVPLLRDAGAARRRSAPVLLALRDPVVHVPGIPVAGLGGAAGHHSPQRPPVPADRALRRRPRDRDVPLRSRGVFGDGVISGANIEAAPIAPQTASTTSRRW